LFHPPRKGYHVQEVALILANFPFHVKDDTMTRLEKKLPLSDEKFKRQIGTTKESLLIVTVLM